MIKIVKRHHFHHSGEKILDVKIPRFLAQYHKTPVISSCQVLAHLIKSPLGMECLNDSVGANETNLKAVGQVEYIHVIKRPVGAKWITNAKWLPLKSLWPESLLTDHQWCLMAFTWGQFYRKFWRYQSLKFNSSPPSAASMRQWIGSASVQIMACRLGEDLIKTQNYSFTKMHITNPAGYPGCYDGCPDTINSLSPGRYGWTFR